MTYEEKIAFEKVSQSLEHDGWGALPSGRSLEVGPTNVAKQLLNGFQLIEKHQKSFITKPLVEEEYKEIIPKQS